MTKKKEIVEEELELYPGERVISVEIEGRKPGLLMHNVKGMLNSESTKRGMCVHGVKYGKQCDECVESSAYRMDSGELYIPSEALSATLWKAAGGHKIKGAAIRPQIAGCTRIEPYQVGLGIKEYDVDGRFVKVGPARVLRHRPWIEEWKAQFYLIFDPSDGLEKEKLLEILMQAGRRNGILDFRPECRGRFGTFLVTKFEEAKVSRE